MRVMSAGDGYAYLLASVAAGDGHRSMTTPLIRYYTEKGTPPGRWLGDGLAGFGHGDLTSGATVTEEQLRRLLGQGRDPITGAPLGLPYYQRATVAQRITERVERLDPALDPAARAAALERIKAEEHARGAWRVVAGYDYTFSVPKSVSTLWAVADAVTQAMIVRAHHAAIADVVALMERDVAMTRVGHNGVAQVAVRGLVATAYDHYDSRSSDPQLHTHVVIANKVQGVDGKWRALDGRPMHAAVVALSEHYNAILADQLCRGIGVGWEQRARGTDRNPAWEIIGVSDDLIREFSSRAIAIDAEKDRLVATYAADHGHQPNTTTILRLRQQATLVTRPDKSEHSLAELTGLWRHRATALLGQDATGWALQMLATSACPPIVRAGDLAVDDLTALGQIVVAEVGVKRSTWRRWNLHAEASRQTMGLRFASTDDRDAVIGLIADAAEAASLRLTPPGLTSIPAAFRRADGSSVFRPRHATVYTSAALLAAEDRLLDLSRTRVAPAIDSDAAARPATSPNGRGITLAADQRRVVEQIATSGRSLDLLVGPAGTGKTTTLAALRRTWEHAYGAGSVLGLAPSAAAADVLAAELGIGCENTAKWLFEYDRGRWDLTAGQLVIVDEASLAGTVTLDRIAGRAAEVGAKVLLVGDWAQLAAVDAGGAFGMLVRDRDHGAGAEVAELVDVRRFAAEWEKAASLQLRRGDAEAIDAYDEHGRLVGGEYETVLDAAYQAWRADTRAGKTSIVIAEATDTVIALNNRARTDRILAGQVALDGAALRDGTVAGRGDVIVTRQNDRHLSTGAGWVKNGDRWTVQHAHGDGSLSVRRVGGRRRGGQVTLPAGYVAEQVELAYAITAHRAQGATVDTAHLLVRSASMTREAFYVAMTRGRHSNIAYVATDEAHLEAHQHTPGFVDAHVTARSVLYGVLQHESAENSAHGTLAAEHEAWSSIAQLGAEYETIAQTAQAERFATALGCSGLDPDDVHRIISGESFGPLIAQLRRVEAAGHEPEQALARAVRGGRLDQVDDAAAVLAARIDTAAAAHSGGTRPRRRTRFIAGLIPEATGPMPADMRRSLTELRDLLAQRASALAEQAVHDGQPWTRQLGPPPADPTRRDAWQQQVQTIAAYRDLYGITSSYPLGPEPSSQGQHLTLSRATIALRRAQDAAGRPGSGRAGSEQHLDTGHDLSR